jgi:hypothetical protein
MTSVIARMRSALQVSISSTGDQFVAFIYKGRVLLGGPYKDEQLWVINLIVYGRKEDFKVLR